MALRILVLLVYLVVTAIAVELLGNHLGTFLYGPNATARMVFRATYLLVGAGIALIVFPHGIIPQK